MSVNAASTKIEEITDPLERMLKKTGCIDLHYQLQVRNMNLLMGNQGFRTDFVVQFADKFSTSQYCSFQMKNQ